MAPFLIGGAGFAKHEVEVTSIGGTAVNFKNDDTVFAYQQVTGAKQVIIDRRKEGEEEVATDKYRKRHQRFLEALGGLTGTDSD